MDEIEDQAEKEYQEQVVEPIIIEELEKDKAIVDELTTDFQEEPDKEEIDIKNECAICKKEIYLLKDAIPLPETKAICHRTCFNDGLIKLMDKVFAGPRPVEWY